MIADKDSLKFKTIGKCGVSKYRVSELRQLLEHTPFSVSNISGGFPLILFVNYTKVPSSPQPEMREELLIYPHDRQGCVMYQGKNLEFSLVPQIIGNTLGQEFILPQHLYLKIGTENTPLRLIPYWPDRPERF